MIKTFFSKLKKYVWILGLIGTLMAIGVFGGGIYVLENENDGQDDKNGHGTLVASIVSNVAKNKHKKYYGVAPDSTIIPVQVLDKYGGGTYSQVIDGIPEGKVKLHGFAPLVFLSVCNTDCLSGQIIAEAQGDPFVYVGGGQVFFKWKTREVNRGVAVRHQHFGAGFLVFSPAHL